MAKKNSGAGNVIFGIIIVLAVMAAIPPKVWAGLLIIVATVFVLIKLFGGSKKRSPPAAPDISWPPPQRAARPTAPKVARPAGRQINITQGPPAAPIDVPVTVASTPTPNSFRIPTPAKGAKQEAEWIPPGQQVMLGKTPYSGGMVYLGRSLATPNGDNDPALIDLSKSIKDGGNFQSSQMGYWPSFSAVSAEARGAYIAWLANGRRDPTADIGYVFLFFYGLERRAIVDVAADGRLRSDWPIIAEEIRQLLVVYGQNSSFRGYASALLQWVSLDDKSIAPYNGSFAEAERGYELPLEMKYALGRTAVDGVPVPGPLALAWTRAHPVISLKTPASRCKSEFDRLFLEKYQAEYGAGIRLQKNRTKLKYAYRAASAGFRGYKDVTRSFGDFPDVTVLTAPVKSLEKLAQAVTKELDAFSRYVGKNPAARSSLEAILQLPLSLWPEKTRHALQSFLNRVGDGILVLSFRELLDAVEAQGTPTKDRLFGLSRALESMDIAIEPDFLMGVKAPKLDDKVVLFHCPKTEVVDRAAASYKAAQLTLQLSSTIASADGEFSAAEINFLRVQVDAWAHLTIAQRHRLRAHLRLLTITPMSLTSLKKRFEPLPQASRDALASFIAGLAQADGKVSADELKSLEKAYKVLGVDPKRVYSDVHAGGSVAAPTVSTAATPEGSVAQVSGLHLDPERIKRLQQDTEKVSTILADIFKDDAPQEPTAVQVAEVEPESDMGFMGLDKDHSTFVRMLMSRPQWTREELLDVAGDLDLMLDGALEKINDASFDAHGIPFTEGDDPIDINSEALEKVTA
jgi:tellurite resistance protein